MWGFELALMLAMIGVNSVFAAYEIALASVPLARLKRLVDEGRSGAHVALYMKQNVEASLAVVQLGITLVGAIAAAVGGAGAQEKVAPALIRLLGVSATVADVLAIAFVVVPLIVVTIIFGELIPMVFALRNAERVCLTLSPAMRWFSFSVWPAVWAFEAIVMAMMSWGERRLRPGEAARPRTAELQELRAIAAMARASRLIGHREEGIILGATRIPARPVCDIMLPAAHMSTLDVNATLSDNLIAAHRDMHTRFPVVEKKGDAQSVIGYVNVKDMIAARSQHSGDPSLREILRPLPSFQHDQPISDCLERLMREHTHLALIRDASGLVVGMISLEDILEELVGEIEDEYDRLPAHVVASGTSWLVGGGAPLDRVKGATGLDLAEHAPPAAPGAPAPSLSTWIVGHLAREPRGGDVVERGPVRVVVRKVRRTKVQEAHVAPRGSPA